MDVPALTADQMRELDRIVVEELGIGLIQMMENAGRGLAELIIRRFRPGTVTVLAGPGANGGGGLVAARHLVDRGVGVTVVLSSDASRMDEVPARQLRIVEGIGIRVLDDPIDADVIVDAMIGYSLRGEPYGRAAELIRWVLRAPAPACSLDTPSGLDVTTGVAGNPCVRATATLTLALPKQGLYRAPSYVGELYLADISVPRVAYERLGVEPPGDLFAEETLVRLR